MAREHARILTSIWDLESDFRDLSPSAQRMYFMLMSQRSLNHAGVLPLTVKKWSNNSAGTSTEDMWAELKVLDAKRYIVIDEDTEEVLIRTHIRNDGVARQPNVLKAALRLAAGVESRRLRAVLAGELRRIGSEHANRVADELVAGAENPISEPIAKGSRKGSDNPSGTLPKETPLEGLPEPFARDTGEGVGEGGSVTTVTSQVLKTSSAQKRGTRIPEDFVVTPKMVEWAKVKTPRVDGRRETEKFINFWTAKAGREAIKIDWAATWRNWMLTADERLPKNQTSGYQSQTDLNIVEFMGRTGTDAQILQLPRGES